METRIHIVYDAIGKGTAGSKGMLAMLLRVVGQRVSDVCDWFSVRVSTKKILKR